MSYNRHLLSEHPKRTNSIRTDKNPIVTKEQKAIIRVSKIEKELREDFEYAMNKD